MSGLFRPPDVAACARCGSGRVHPKLLVMGPIAGIDSDSRSFLCEACGYDGLPVMFDTEEARARFEAEKRGPPEASPSEPRQGILSIPILPVLTEPLVDLKVLDLIPVRLASVVGVGWDGRQIAPTRYRASFQEYWDAIGGPRYNAARVFMLDLTGINRANPNFDVLRHLVKRCAVWLDLGAREPEEIMDGDMLHVERVGAGSKTLGSREAFRELHSLSSEVLPCLDWDGRVVWGDPREARTDLRDVAKALCAIGFDAVCVMDVARLGTEAGPDPGLLAQIDGLAIEVYLGGGLREEGGPGLGERGIAGALVDPYTPVIRDLLRPPTKEGPAEAKAPEPVPRPTPPRDAPADAG